MPEIGDEAPDFRIPTDSGGEFHLASERGKAVVVYFYPKDDTSGCTKEAIAFTEAQEQFEAAGAMIIGISPDDPEKHDKFKIKHDLGIKLGSDVDKSVSESYGVWVEKNMYGRKYMGVERSTFLVDADGKIAQVWRKVKVPGHAEKVLSAVKEL